MAFSSSARELLGREKFPRQHVPTCRTSSPGSVEQEREACIVTYSLQSHLGLEALLGGCQPALPQPTEAELNTTRCTTRAAERPAHLSLRPRQRFPKALQQVQREGRNREPSRSHFQRLHLGSRYRGHLCAPPDRGRASGPGGAGLGAPRTGSLVYQRLRVGREEASTARYDGGRDLTQPRQ